MRKSTLFSLESFSNEMRSGALYRLLAALLSSGVSFSNITEIMLERIFSAEPVALSTL